MLEHLLGTISRLARSILRVSAENLPMRKVFIRAVIFQEKNLWCAQCLEFDIAVQANTRDELITELERVFGVYVEMALEGGHQPFAGLPKAPARFFEFYERSRPSKSTRPIKVLDRSAAPCIIPTLRDLEPILV